MKITDDQLRQYFDSFQSSEKDHWMKDVENYLNDEQIEMIVEHLEEFYGIKDDDQLGMLAQIFISGFICAKLQGSK